MADIRLGQSSSGKWKLTLTNNDTRVPASVVIPVTLLYQGGNPVNLNVQRGSTSSVVTEWYTPLGTIINTNEITISGEKTVGDTTYRVTTVNWTSVTPAGGGGDDPTLSLTYTGGNIAYNGGSATITITSNTGWTISSNQSWATLNTTSGSGTGSVTVTFGNNSGNLSSRIVTLTAKTTDNRITRTLQITQNADTTAPRLTIRASKTSGVSDAGETVTIYVESNTSWTLQKTQDWASFNGSTSGSGDGNVGLVIGQNISTNSRQIDVTATYGNNQTQTITITQNASSTGPSLTLTINPDTVSSTAGQTTVRVVSNTSWTLSCNRTWARLGGTSGSGNADIILTYDANDASGASQRTATITATYNNGQTKTAGLTQEASTVTPTLEISVPETIGADGGSLTITITSNTGWTLSVASTASGYARIDGLTSGTGPGTRTLIIDPNTDPSSTRSIRVNAKFSSASQIKTYKDVTQAAAEKILTISANKSVVSDAGDVVELEITSNIDWTISSDQSWATVSTPTSGSGSSTRTLSIEEYDGTVSREVTVTVSGEGLTGSVTINQNGTNYLKFWDTDRNKFADVAWDEEGRDQIHVDSNIEWLLTASDSWISVVNNAGTPVTGGVGNDFDIYVKFAHNDSDVSDRDGTITISAADPNLGVSDDLLAVHQRKQDPKFAIFVDKITAVDGDREEAYNVTDFTVCANTYWQVVQQQCDWISPGADCVGNSTSQLPGGKKQITLSISPNPTVSERYGTIIIRGGSAGDPYDTWSIMQRRGLSTIDIDGTATEVIFSGQTVEFTVTCNTNWHVISYGTLQPQGFDNSTAFHEGTSALTFNVPANETSGYIDYTITVQTDDGAQYVVSDSYSFRQIPQPPKNGVLHGWYDDDASESGTRHMQYYHDVPLPEHGPKSAADTDWVSPFIFYMRTNTTNSVVSVECWSLKQGTGYKLTEDELLPNVTCQIFDNNGNEITNGGGAGQWFGPTVNDGETWVPFRIHLPANTRNSGSGKVGNARRFIIKFKTFDYPSWQPLPGDIDFNWHDSLKIEIDQYGNECYIDGYEIYAFMFGNMQQLDETATTIPAYVEGTPGTAANCYYPAVIINGQKHCTAYQGTTTETMEDYIKLNGNLPYTDQAVLELTSDTGRPTIKYENWSVIQYPEANKPFEVYVPANTGYTATGEPKEFDLTLTYKTAIPAISKTIHVTQEYAQVTPPELDLNLYVQTMYGGQGRSVKEDTVNTTNNRQIYFSLTGSFAQGEMKFGLANASISNFGQCTFGDGWYDMMTNPEKFYDQEWPGHSVDAIFTIKDSVTNDFTFTMTGYKTSDPAVTTILTLHVHLT